MDQIRLSKKMAEEEIDEDFDVEDDDDDISSAEMDAKRLRKALDTMPADERTILVMKYQDDFSIKDIAETFKITESAVKMRLKRGREKLKQKYMDYVLFWIILAAKIIDIFRQS